MPARIHKPDIPNVASKLPAPLQWPAAAGLELARQVFGDIPLPATTAVWAGGGGPKPGGTGGTQLKSLSKELGELINAVFKPKPGAGLPQRLRFTNIGREGQMQFHPPNAEIGPAVFEASPADVDKLINAGSLDLEQPPIRAMDPIRAKLREVLDAAGPEYKASQLKRGISKSAK